MGMERKRGKDEIIRDGKKEGKQVDEEGKEKKGGRIEVRGNRK